VAVKASMSSGAGVQSFLSRLCGGEAIMVGVGLFVPFLSRLCGGEVKFEQASTLSNFLSRLCGGEEKS